MFSQSYVKHLEEEVKWLRERNEELMTKLSRAVRLHVEPLTPQPPMRYDAASETFVPATAKEIYEESKALQELLAQNM